MEKDPKKNYSVKFRWAENAGNGKCWLFLSWHQINVSVRSDHLTVMMMVVHVAGIESLVTAIGWRSRVCRILVFVVRNSIAGRYVIVMVVMMVECPKITHIAGIRLANGLDRRICHQVARRTLHETIFDRRFWCCRRNYAADCIRVHVRLCFTSQCRVQFVVGGWSCSIFRREFVVLMWESLRMRKQQYEKRVKTYLFRSNML